MHSIRGAAVQEPQDVASGDADNAGDPPQSEYSARREGSCAPNQIGTGTYKSAKIDILAGCAVGWLMTLPDDSFDCCVTSPPYWGLRDYGVAGQIGLEKTMAEYIAAIVAICREIRRVLKPSGTFWLNLGDCYSGSWGAQSREHGGKHAPNNSALSANQIKAAQRRIKTGARERTELNDKNLCLIPARIALALQADGWIVRSEIIWHKPNPMPESVRDRPTNAHEKIYLLVKQGRYFYNADAIKNPPSETMLRQIADGYNGRAHKDYNGAGAQQASATKSRIIAKARKKIDKQRLGHRRYSGFNDRWDALSPDELTAIGSNARNVWSISPRPFKEAHFATFPPELVERCLKAGCPPGGRILDPFAGSGTTGLVAQRLGLAATLIELNPDYVEIAKRRLAPGIFA